MTKIPVTWIYIPYTTVNKHPSWISTPRLPRLTAWRTPHSSLHKYTNLCTHSLVKRHPETYIRYSLYVNYTSFIQTLNAFRNLATRNTSIQISKHTYKLFRYTVMPYHSLYANYSTLIQTYFIIFPTYINAASQPLDQLFHLYILFRNLATHIASAHHWFPQLST